MKLFRFSHSRSRFLRTLFFSNCSAAKMIQQETKKRTKIRGRKTTSNKQKCKHEFEYEYNRNHFFFAFVCEFYSLFFFLSYFLVFLVSWIICTYMFYSPFIFSRFFGVLLTILLGDCRCNMHFKFTLCICLWVCFFSFSLLLFVAVQFFSVALFMNVCVAKPKRKLFSCLIHCNRPLFAVTAVSSFSDCLYVVLFFFRALQTNSGFLIIWLTKEKNKQPTNLFVLSYMHIHVVARTNILISAVLSLLHFEVYLAIMFTLHTFSEGFSYAFFYIAVIIIQFALVFFFLFAFLY